MNLAIHERYQAGHQVVHNPHGMIFDEMRNPALNRNTQDTIPGMVEFLVKEEMVNKITRFNMLLSEVDTAGAYHFPIRRIDRLRRPYQHTLSLVSQVTVGRTIVSYLYRTCDVITRSGMCCELITYHGKAVPTDGYFVMKPDTIESPDLDILRTHSSIGRCLQCPQLEVIARVIAMDLARDYPFENDKYCLRAGLDLNGQIREHIPSGISNIKGMYYIAYKARQQYNEGNPKPWCDLIRTASKAMMIAQFVIIRGVNVPWTKRILKSSFGHIPDLEQMFPLLVRSMVVRAIPMARDGLRKLVERYAVIIGACVVLRKAFNQVDLTKYQHNIRARKERALNVIARNVLPHHRKRVNAAKVIETIAYRFVQNNFRRKELLRRWFISFRLRKLSRKCIPKHIAYNSVLNGIYRMKQRDARNTVALSFQTLQNASCHKGGTAAAINIVSYLCLNYDLLTKAVIRMVITQIEKNLNLNAGNYTCAFGCFKHLPETIYLPTIEYTRSAMA